MGTVFCSEKRRGDQNEMKASAKDGFPDLDVLLFPRQTDAELSHALLFMSKGSRGAF